MSRITGAEAARLPKSGLHFDLPVELIAQEPASNRTDARLLVWHRQHQRILEARVSDLPDFVQPGDVLVFNDTKVIPARLHGRTRTGGAVELLLIRRSSLVDAGAREGITKANRGAETWHCLGRPGRRLSEGTTLRLGNGAGATVVAASASGRYEIEFETDDVMALLDRWGEVPLPPYIKRPDGPLRFDHERYQTVFAAWPGAVAAPTAGLHFTPTLLDELRAAGVRVTYLTLHVGPATFLPVRTEDLADHAMEPEWCFIPASTAETINVARRENHRVIAVGTTTTRALESAAGGSGTLLPGARWADQFIVPGHRFRVIDCLFTNFHLPGSTLLALVGAFAGVETTLGVYAEAVHRRYRFYSYGDAMFVQ